MNSNERHKAYTKRITVVSGANAYICEYLGTFPEANVSHGNCVFGGTEYVRTHPGVQARIKEQCKLTKNRPKKIYTDVTLLLFIASYCLLLVSVFEQLFSN